LIGISKVVRDITQRKAFEKQLKVSLHEKEILLREIHHRVKNNLQIISSLLNLQVATESSDTVRKGLIDNQSRIRSMALVHELLYLSPDLGRINFTEYLRTLTARLLGTYSVGPERIELAVEGEPVLLDIDTAIPCGLIVNELVANAIGHAFPRPRTGRITVTILMRSGELLSIEVRDDGIGIPADVTLESAGTFGLRIAQTLTRQLAGTIRIERDHGTVVHLEFPLAKQQEPRIAA
jgi:two-component sensor histidine kinase